MIFFYVLAALNMWQYYETRADIHITGAWACVILAALARMEAKAERRERP